jgi:hypothetical protein
MLYLAVMLLATSIECPKNKYSKNPPKGGQNGTSIWTWIRYRHFPRDPE